MYIVYTLMCILILVSGEENNVDNVLEKLSSLNKYWLKATSFPETAFLLKRPPYSYYTESLLDQPFDGPVELLNSTITLPSPKNDENSKCNEDLMRILKNLNSDWALQMIDSDGKPSSGLLRGGVIWPGHFGECTATHVPADNTGYGSFSGQYCVTTWKLNVSRTYPNLPLTIGVCIPDSCSEEYVSSVGKGSLYILDRIPLLKNYSSKINLNTVSCKLKEKKLDTSSIIYLVFLSIFLSLSIVGTFVTVCLTQKGSKKTTQNAINFAAERNVNSTDSETTKLDPKHKPFPSYLTLDKDPTSSEKASLAANDDIPASSYTPIGEESERKSAFQRICECFCMFDNGKKILNTESSGEQLASIHGIRFLSLTWVILGHTFISSISIIGNRIDVLKLMDTFAFQMLLQAPFSVDSFFLLSGFLLSYLFLKEADKKSGKINWIYFYAHRIWRLTPAYMIVVFFYLFVFKFLGSGPFWDDHHCDAARGSWWKYLLYINNFIPIKQMCIGWSWYLANDMQFYIISPLFLYPLWRWPVAGVCLLFSILLGTWITTASLSYYYDLIPMFVGVTQTKDFDTYSKRMWDSFDLIYDKPYCRIAPYIIGVVLGYVLYRLNHRKHFLSRWQQMLGWCVAAFCGLSVVFGLYHVSMSRTTALFYNSLCRSSFSISLAWLIFACETGHGGFIYKLLSWKAWIPLSRLTYCAYLIHPIFIHAYYQAYQAEFIFTNLIAVTSFLGFLIMSYAAAFMFSILFESPLMNLEKLLLKRKTNRN